MKIIVDDKDLGLIRFFAITFGHGWTKLNDDLLIQDFGLRVAVNALNDDKVKQIYSTSLSESMRRTAFAPAHRGISSFGNDPTMDLLSKVGGAVEPEKPSSEMSELIETDEFIKRIEGAKSAKISGDFKLADIAEKAQEAFNLYHSEYYKKTGFKFIDNFRPVASKKEAEELFDRAVENMRGPDISLELINPEWEQAGLYCYRFPKQKEAREELRIADYLDWVKETHDSKIDLFKHKINSEIVDTDFKKPLAISKCLVGTIEKGGKLYAIDQGVWYNLSDSFKNNIDELFKDARIPNDEDRPKIAKKCAKQNPDKSKRSKRQLGYENELDYNTKLAKYKGWICLDQINWYPNEDAPGDKVELCDLLDISNKRLIHLKIGRGSSHNITYLFNQGLISARNLKRGNATIQRYFEKPSFRKRLNPDEQKAVRLALSNFKTQEWEIVYYLMDYPNQKAGHTIPFFARLAFKHVVEEISLWDYRGVKVCFLDPSKGFKLDPPSATAMRSA